MRTWTPLEGPFHGFLITHNEAISIADYLTVRDGDVGALPADRALCLSPLRRRGAVGARVRRQELAMQPEKRLMMDEIIEGIDELGVLLMGHKKGAYWYGSQLSIEEARELCRTTTPPACR